MSHFLLGVLVLVGSLLPAALPSSARADAQVSVRNSLEFGKRKSDMGSDFIFGGGLRGDAMFGAPHHQAFRLGPAFELRTIDFRSIEGAAGAGVLIPLPGDFPIGLTGMLGYAARKQAPDGAVGIGTVTWGYRGYNYHHWYGYGLNLFFTGRKSLSGDDVVELTGGIEIDVMFTTLVPILAIRNFFTGGDPHEP